MPAARCQEGFDDAVFKRMEGDDDKAPAGLEDRFGRAESGREFAQLVVDEDAQRLKGAGGRMDAARARVHDPGDEVGERAGGADRTLAARALDGAGDGAGMPLLAEARDDIGELTRGGLRHHVGGARPKTAHAHIERTVGAEREAALGRVELHRRDAKVEDDAIDRVMAEAASDSSQIGKPVLDQYQAAAGRLDQSRVDQISPERNGALIAVDADHMTVRGGKDGAGKSAGAEGRIDIHTARTHGEIFNRLTHEHGNVTSQSASDSARAAAAPHHPRAPCGPSAVTREPSCFFSAETFSVASASSARKCLGSQI